MLSESLKDIIKQNEKLTILDPAVGSGAFLVDSFKIIRDSYNRKLSYDEKKDILETQLYGVDIDHNALQITAFSLYLALLEDESSEFIKNKFENSHPILPSLIGKTLIKANIIYNNEVLENKKFDFIVSNPPWGSVPKEDYEENNLERFAIDNKDNEFPEYKHVADYERSQAFLKRIQKWRYKHTTTAMIVRKSTFLNDNSENFRRDFIKSNKIEYFYELSNYNKILFKKKKLGTLKEGKDIYIGASEPCAVITFKPNLDKEDYSFNYISPKMTNIGEHFGLIHYTNNDLFYLNQKLFIENDALWRILVNTDLESFNLIQNKIINQKEIEIEAKSGFQPKANMER